MSRRLRPGQVRIPSRPPSVSEDTVEASATAMADEMERVRDLPSDDDDDDMGDEEVEELFRPVELYLVQLAQRIPIDLDGDEGGGGEEDGENADDDEDQVSLPLYL
ncbi:uncharacterized protein [Miscanthus floridulus]|uniref:uncharacterized protein isoform X2 n=1 Tax=Miscanthus floridulus TaxID=154761 RepID=UPI003458CBA9